MISQTLPGIDLDADLSLEQLLPAASRAALAAKLARLCEAEVQLLGAGQSLPAGWHGQPLQHELETVGWLATPAPLRAEQLTALAELVQAVMAANARYYRACSLHIDVVQDDYAELKRRHEALQDSEQRYRDLNAELETRVQQQVAQIEAAQRRLYLADRLASVGQLAAGMAHEINTPLGYLGSNFNAAAGYVADVQAFAGTLASATTLEAVRTAWQKADLDASLTDFQDLLAQSQIGLKQIGRIINDLRTFSRIDSTAQTEVFDVNEAIEATVRVLAPQWPHCPPIKCELQAVPALVGDRAAFGQALYNLLQNGLLAMVDAGNAELEVRTRLEADHILVEIKDRGVGIAPELLPHVFEPFFTTRDIGQGSGLGLTVARDAVRALGGDIEISSEAGVGTVVSLSLPVTGSKQEPGP